MLCRCTPILPQLSHPGSFHPHVLVIQRVLQQVEKIQMRLDAMSRAAVLWCFLDKEVLGFYLRNHQPDN